MKRLLFITVLVASLCSCSSGSDDEKTTKLDFIHIEITTDKGESPTGTMALFYLPDGKSLKGCPYARYGSGSSMDYYILASLSDGTEIFPVSGTIGIDFKSSKTSDFSSYSLFWYQLSSIYGTPLQGGTYALFIQLDNINGYNAARTYKVFTIDKNKNIVVKIPCAKNWQDEVNAEWTITDY